MATNMMLRSSSMEHSRRYIMKQFKNLATTLFLTLLFTTISLYVASRIFIPKWIDKDHNRMTYIVKGFYNEKRNTIDVLFTGNSDVFRGVSPMEIYDRTGYTSYNFVSAGQRIWFAYYMLEEALRYQNPKVVFFNIDELFFTSQTTANAHKLYDNMSFGLPKIQGILDKTYENKNRLAHFLPIFSYHGRYKELTWNDFKYAFYHYEDPLKGMDLISEIEPYLDSENYMKFSEEIAVAPKKNVEYLDKMRELCQKKGIEFVLFEVPSPDSWNYKKHNMVQDYADKYGLKFLDLNLHTKDMNIDWTRDTADGGDHLNIFGAVKVSNYLSAYLTKNFDLKNHKNDEKYEMWKRHYEEYLDFKKRALDELQN